METPTDLRWKERVVGHDSALVRTFGSATMAFGLGPARGAAKETARLAAILGDGVVSLRHSHQVHGRTIHPIEAGNEPVVEVGPGDGLVTSALGVGLLVWTADCVPVLLTADGVIAAVHSGWRGCAADVVGAAVDLLQQRHGVSPGTLRIVLGPSICGACYEVGPEVVEALGRFSLDEARWLADNHVDLRGFLSARLERFGVPPTQIETVGGCTFETPDLASFRRDGKAAGRQWSMVFLNR